ncbi:HtaA protein [Corynebacterium nuruki]|uniref:HtaA protein n=1 Tax=Corynebacterium nuruki TaxID=1032851 RepID=UPI0039BF5706
MTFLSRTGAASATAAVASGLLLSALTVPAVVAAPAASAAMPTVPDTLPVFPEVSEDPQITVTREDGTPVTGETPVHRGDVLLVHGTGFSPEANRGGFVMPVPPGTANGVYVLYSGFGEAWRPSEGAPGEARTHPHDQLAWVLPDASLAALPTVPVDMRAPIAREAQPMAADGTFTARLVVDPPAETPGDRFGVYVYPAAGSVNAAEEIYVPVPFSTEPGPNTPAPASPDLVLDASAVARVADMAQGGLTGRDGAVVLDDGRVGFTADGTVGEAGNTERYRGTVHATARFSLADVALRDPWIETRDDGTRVLTAEVSDSWNSATDAMHRVDLGPADALS